MPDQLLKNLPFLDDATRTQLYGSLYAAAAYPRGHPIREGVILSYDHTMKILCIAATAFAVPPLIFSLFMPNYYLGDTQNAVDETGLAGEIGERERRNESESVRV